MSVIRILYSIRFEGIITADGGNVPGSEFEESSDSVIGIKVRFFFGHLAYRFVSYLFISPIAEGRNGRL